MRVLILLTDGNWSHPLIPIPNAVPLAVARMRFLRKRPSWLEMEALRIISRLATEETGQFLQAITRVRAPSVPRWESRHLLCVELRVKWISKEAQMHHHLR